MLHLFATFENVRRIKTKLIHKIHIIQIIPPENRAHIKRLVKLLLRSLIYFIHVLFSFYAVLVPQAINQDGLPQGSNMQNSSQFGMEALIAHNKARVSLLYV